MIEQVAGFADYFASIRRRTRSFVRTIPADRLGWSPRAGEFTCGELVRHLAAAEQMFVGAVVEGRWRYPGHTHDSTQTLDELIAELEVGHAVALERLRALDDAVLAQPRPTLNGPPARAWRLLMALVEHEIHHRSQLALYLALMGVEPPQIYGLGVEDVIALATG
jgi:uncharacterized damage-inducible protein DinB